jgi:hypothetical protein
LRHSYLSLRWYVLAVQHDCAICRHVGGRTSPTKTVLGLRTADAGLLAQALARYEGGDYDSEHVLLPVCPEHAVDVYRGRIAGVEMAWRVA